VWEEMEFAGTVLVALALGAAIGMERQWRQRMAGLRTNALVSAGAALFVTLGMMTPGEVSPTRVAAQVVSGIGFLGGGVILREGLNVRGLNTAATLWCSAAVGTLVGAGFMLHAVIGAASVLLAHVGLRPLAHAVNRQPIGNLEQETRYRMTVVCRTEDETVLRGLLLNMVGREALMLRTLRSEDIDGGAKLQVRAELVAPRRSDALVERVASRLSFEPGVSSLSWEITEVAEE
jgi:putative Mg2+ transporter-C (MgtC) family protein